MTATVVREDGTAAWSATESRPADAFGPGRETEFRVRLPLDEVEPGTYRLTVTADCAGVRANAPAFDFHVVEEPKAP